MRQRPPRSSGGVLPSRHTVGVPEAALLALPRDVGNVRGVGDGAHHAHA